MLLYFGAQPSVKDNNGNTALHLAVLHGNLECVKVILNTNNTKSLPLNDFNDEGKCVADFWVCLLFGSSSVQGSCSLEFTLLCFCTLTLRDCGMESGFVSRITKIVQVQFAENLRKLFLRHLF